VYSFNRLPWLSGVILLALGTAGCGDAAEPRKVVAPDAGTEQADAGKPAKREPVRIDQAPVPARFSAALPSSTKAMREWLRGGGDPPEAHAIDLISMGDAGWLARLQTASSAIPEKDHLAWGQLWLAALDFQPASPKFCSAARPVMQGPASAQRFALVGLFASQCATGSDAEVMMRADTPSWAVIKYFDPWGKYFGDQEAHPPYHPRLAAAAREIILAPQVKPQIIAPPVEKDAKGDVLMGYDPTAFSESPRSAAFTMTHMKDPRADRALLDIHAQIKDREVADEVALAFRHSSNPKGKALAAAACKRRKDPACDTPGDFAAMLGIKAVGAGDGAADGAEDGETADEDSPEPERVIRARIDELRAMGFRNMDRLDAAKLDHSAPELLLMEAHVAYGFDVETGMWPNHHDSLLRQLAALTSPALDDAVFDESAPAIEDEAAPYQLTAYAGGKRFRIRAENLGDWYDVGAVLDLLNAMMADRKQPERYFILASEDQLATVVAATPEAIGKAVRAGWFDFGDPAQAEATGRAFEDQVRKQLSGGGED
jgi:hypothetical protein